MKSLALESVRQLNFVDAPIPKPQPGEALIRVHSVGICGSDLSIYTGTHPKITPPAVLGHEVLGTVASLGSAGASLHVGDTVVCVAGVGCGRCDQCASRNYNLCADMQVIGGHRPGGLAEYLVVPTVNLVALPVGTRDPRFALIEPAAVSHHAATKVPEDALTRGSVAVYGLGAVGLLLVQILLAKGVQRVYGVDPQEHARAAAERFGAITAHPDEIESAVGNELVDAVLECSGNGRALNQGISLVRHGGTIVLVGIQHHPMEVDWVRIQRYEKTITGVQMYRPSDFESIVELLDQHKLRFDGVPVTFAGFEDAPEIFSGLAQGTLQGKFLITIEKENNR